MARFASPVRIAALFGLLACKGPVAPGDSDTSSAEGDADTDTDADADADTDADTDTDPPCQPVGRSCNPIPVTGFPFTDTRDTSNAPESLVDSYGCAPGTDESGGEWWYVVTLAEDGILTASIPEVAGDGIDIDVHLLGSTDPNDCIDRDNSSVAAALTAGTYLLALDTWNGPDQAGPYTLTVDFLPGAGGSCDMEPTDVRMFWTSCAVADCFTSGSDVFLATPAVGPVVKEAHLVTTSESFPSGWPTSFTDGITNHYAVSEAATGYVTSRTEPWAPAGEGGSEYGQGATGAPIPAADEGWYINMYWRNRPAGGTRMIVRNPANGRAVVASAGWETGPGANTAIAGVAEEVHDWLGTGHLSSLEIGFALDQSLPLGPITCP